MLISLTGIKSASEYVCGEGFKGCRTCKTASHCVLMQTEPSEGYNDEDEPFDQNKFKQKIKITFPFISFAFVSFFPPAASRTLPGSDAGPLPFKDTRHRLRGSGNKDLI